MATNSPTTFTVYTDGCALCREAVGVMRSLAQDGEWQIREERVDDLSAEELRARGIRATPAVAFGGEVTIIGCPSREEVTNLVRRAEIDEVILGYSIPKSEAILRFSRGEGQRDDTARALAREFYPFSEEFPLFLAATISHVRDEHSRLLLVSNLYEEHGNLDVERVHPALFRRFMRGVGVPTGEVGADRSSPGTVAAHMLTEICRAGPVHRALAAIYVLELLFGPTCEVIMKGLQHLHLDPEAVDYWMVHSEAEEHHAEQLRTALFRACHSAADWRESVDTARDVSRMFYELFDFIARSAVFTTEEELDLFERVKSICATSPHWKDYPIVHQDGAYYFAIQLGEPGDWFLRALCDSDRRYLATRLAVDDARLLAPGCEVDAAPKVFGTSRAYFGSPERLSELRPLVLAAYERQVRDTEARVRVPAR